MSTEPIVGPSRPSSQVKPASSTPSTPQWRQFNFFDVESIHDSQDLTLPPQSLSTLTPPVLITPTSPASPLSPSLIVSSGSQISVLDKQLNVGKTWRWEGGRMTCMVEAGGLLVGVGEEEGARWPVLRVWDLSKEEKKKPGAGVNGTGVGSGPVLMRNVRIQHGQRPHPVSCIALTSNLSHLAIGLGDGTVLLYRHLLQSLTTSPTALTSLPKARVIHESHEPITGLGFREPHSSSLTQPHFPAVKGLSSAPQSAVAAAAAAPAITGISLFVVTTNRVLCAPVSGKGGEACTIDELGCGLGCAVIDTSRREMIMVRDEAIYLYGPEGRGACYAYEGPKSAVAVFGHNLVITSPPFIPSASSASATVRHYVSKNGENGSTDIAKVTVFDLQNKFVAYSGTFKDGVRTVFSQWGAIFIYGGTGKLSRLDEHSTSAKLDVLYRRNLYTLAISLARSQGVSESGVAEIHRRYGDHLYGKGDFDGAMAQFVRTLGSLQPSYVIRKFLDAQRIHNLTTYLQELHARNLANPDHTTLLLNCYTKTSDRARLDAFIKTEARRSDDDQLPFDLETAIRVCRQAGFFEHATYLAKKYGRHEDYLKIQIEDADEYDEALRYLRSLGPEACEENLIRYGRTLLQNESEATTDLLIDLCSGNLGKKVIHKSNHQPSSGSHEKSPNGLVGNSSGPAVLSYLGYNRVTSLLNRDASPASGNASAPALTTNGGGTNGEKSQAQVNGTGSRVGSKLNAAVESNQHEKQDSSPATATEVNGSGYNRSSEINYTPPSPRNFFAHFVDHRDLFIHFLEDVALALWGQRVDPSKISSTTTTTLVTEPARRLPRRVDMDKMSEESDESTDQRAVWNTLLELYLSSASELSSRAGEDDVDRVKWLKERALALIVSEEIPYDPMHALLLCSTAGFTDGLVMLWQLMGMYEDVIRFWISRDRDETSSSATIKDNVSHISSQSPSPATEIMRHLELYGSTHRHLYPLVLRHITSSPSVLARHQSDLIKIIEKIDEERIMPPLAVVQLLSRNGVASVGSVKDWLRAKVVEAAQEIESDKLLVESYRSETAAKRKQIVDLANPNQPEVFQVTRCAACNGQLDLPSVHFMCKHSYHQRCLSDSEPECILCARQHSVVREIRRNQTRLADRHDLFLQEVHEADDGFAVVAGAFGRGLFQKDVEAA